MDKSPDSQSHVLKFLGKQTTHAGCSVKRIDTHAAVVFLAGSRAFKVKRTVRFPFLDYSTLEKRKAACAAELEVNREFATELYRRIVPITQDPNGQLALDGEGEPIEWAVEMVRFDENQTLDHIAETIGISDSLAEELGIAVANMHARAPVVEPGSWLHALESYIDQNYAVFRQEPELLKPNTVNELEVAFRSSLDALRPLLLSRGKLGFIRRGHGDLHLGNIVLIEDRPVPFDAIEFDPVVASGDTLYDIAFLLMDLVERKMERAANIVLNKYFTDTHKTENDEGLAALPFFMALRAAIRSKVTLARAQNLKAGEQAAARREAKTYLQLAHELLQPPKPILIAIGGLSGTGKSLLARDLAAHVPPHPGALVVRSDVERKRMFGVGETERLPDHAYESDVSESVYTILAERAARIVAAGHSAIVDAVFAKSHERGLIEKIASKPGVRFCGFFLTADLASRIRRVNARTHDASDADAAVVEQQETLAIDAVDWIKIEASGSPESTLRHSLEIVRKL